MADGLTQTVTASEHELKYWLMKARSGICHDESSRWYERTKKYEPFDFIEDCLASGGRLPK